MKEKETACFLRRGSVLLIVSLFFCMGHFALAAGSIERLHLVIEESTINPALYKDMLGQYRLIATLPPDTPDPYYVNMGGPISNQFFKKYRLYHLADYHGNLPFHVNPLIVAIRGRDAYLISGQVLGWGVTQNFNLICRREVITITDATRALEWSKFYVGCASLVGEEVTFLDSLHEIEGISNQDVARFKMVGKPEVTKRNDGHDVVLFTWERTGGRLTKWQLHVCPNGVLRVDGKRELGEGVGKYEVW